MSTSKLISAGFLIRSRQKFLLCHATKKKNDTPKQFDGAWTISKGVCDNGEKPIDAAVRELKEETNIDLTSDKWKRLLPYDDQRHSIQPLFSYNVNKKNVYVFLLEDEAGTLQDDATLELKCTSLIETDEPKIKHLNGAPEMDGFMFVEREVAHQMVFKSQKFMFAEGFLEEKLKEVGRSFLYETKINNTSKSDKSESE